MNALDVLPSILDLGRHHCVLSVARDRIDAANIAGDSDAAKAYPAANCIWLGRYLGIVELILTMPAATLADAAVQLQAALAWLDSEYDDEWPPDAREMKTRIRPVLVSTAIVTTRAANVDPKMMGFADLADIHRREFPPALIGGNRPGCDRQRVSAPAGPADAELIALCDQLIDVVARQDALYSVRRTMEDEKRTEEQMDALFAERGDIIDRIKETSNVETDQGRDALARAALAIAERDRAGQITPRTKGESLAWMVVKSLASSAVTGPVTS